MLPAAACRRTQAKLVGERERYRYESPLVERRAKPVDMVDLDGDVVEIRSVRLGKGDPVDLANLVRIGVEQLGSGSH